MIVVGWTRYPSPATRATLSGYAHRLVFVGDRDDAYFDLLEKWWKSQERDLVILEHDIVPAPELIDEMLDCPRQWCAAMYPFEGTKLFGLGLTKFNIEMRKRLPNLFDEIAVLQGGPHHPPKHWCALDSHMQGILHHRSGEAVHIHDHPEWIEHGDGGIKWRSHEACLVPSQ